jgi:hypothetical protein
MEDTFSQQIETNSFYVVGLGEATAEEVKEAITCDNVIFNNWELSLEKRRWAEVFYSSIKAAEEAYNQYNGKEIQGSSVRFLVKRALTSIWLCGLPSVLYSRDLFTTVAEIT